jgi:hypothetical protein
MKTHAMVILIIAALVGGCKTSVVEVDTTPPFAPRGIFTDTGDDLVILTWVPNSEPDLAAYRVYASDAYDGVYTFLGQTATETYYDDGAPNGVTVYYAVTALDRSGNESELSHDVAYDTPRPEGFGVILPNFQYVPSGSGYDFSTYSVGPYNDQYTDIFFEHTGGIFYLNVWMDTEIQDVGYTESLYDIGYAPTGGWSPTKDVRLIPGHTYVVKTWDNHYAKVRVRTLSDASMTFDWAYQLQAGNTRLKSPAQRGALQAGSGFAGRSE